MNDRFLPFHSLGHWQPLLVLLGRCFTHATLAAVAETSGGPASDAAVGVRRTSG